MDGRAAFLTELKGCSLWKQLPVPEEAISTLELRLTPQRENKVKVKLP